MNEFELICEFLSLRFLYKEEVKLTFRGYSVRRLQ